MDTEQYANERRDTTLIAQEGDYFIIPQDVNSNSGLDYNDDNEE